MYHIFAPMYYIINRKEFGTNMFISYVWIVIAGYVGLINLLGFALMGIDKAKAKRRAFRIPEATLFTVAIIGGSIGSIIGMRVFHHKTLHHRFTIGMPVILVLQILMVLFIIFGPIWDIRVLG